MLATPVILGEEGARKVLQEQGQENSWYIVADSYNGNYLTVDLDPERLGRCYDSFQETHGLGGDTPMIARSFTELLTQLYEKRGHYWYWLQPDFVSLGDAYDVS